MQDLDIAIHFGVPIHWNSPKSFVDAHDCPTVTIMTKTSGKVGLNTEVYDYRLAYMDRKTDKIHFGSDREWFSATTYLPTLLGYYDTDTDFVPQTGNFSKIVEYFDSRQNDDDFRYALLYLALVSKLDNEGELNGELHKRRSYLMGMRKIVVDAYNASQIKYPSHLGTRFSGCSTVRENDDATMNLAFEELRHAIISFSPTSEIQFNGNIMSDKPFGMVYSFRENLPVCTSYYPDCSYWSSDKKKRDEDARKIPSFTEAKVSDSPIGKFVKGKKYSILEWISKMEQTYVKMKDENGVLVCIRKDHLVLD